MIKISFIIPIYNSSRYLEKLLSNLLSQEGGDYEIIIIDDGSSDSGHEIIKQYQAKSDKIKYFYQENSGPGIARKNGFNKATGELLFFIDSDDSLPNNKVLSTISETYEKSKFEILFFNYLMQSNGKTYSENALKKEGLKTGEYDINIINNYVEGALWSKIFVKRLMHEEYFYDANNYEDYYVTYRYLNNCNKIYFLENELYYSNRDNANSISKEKNIDKMMETIKICKKIYEESKLRKSASILLINCFVMVGRYIIKNYKGSKKDYIKQLREIVKLKDINFKYVNPKNLIKIIQILVYSYI